MKLTSDEKKFLWSKIEYLKKKKATTDKNELFNLLNGDKESFNNEESILILNALEYTFKKELKNPESKIKSEIFKTIQSKLPEEWFGVKYSNLKAKQNKAERKNENVLGFDEWKESNS